jgi:PAS domain S-box-containing protein
MPMVFTDAKIPGNPIIFANDSFLSLTGYDRAEVLGQTLNSMIASGEDPKSLVRIEAAFDGSFDNDPEVRYRRRDGSEFCAAIFISPVQDESGDVVQHFISFVDVTQQKREEHRLRFLLDELNHRTQNTLATVQAIATTLRGSADAEAVETFEGRILALSKAHSLLGRENWNAVSLRDVVEKILQPFGLNDDLVTRFSVDGVHLHLQSKAALTLAMVLHELATNAAKHGALSNGFNGHIDISWKVETASQGDRMRLRWQESGGPPVSPPRRKGFGSRLIEVGLAQDLDGAVHLAYQPAGVVCRIVMPIPKREADGTPWIAPYTVAVFLSSRTR